MRLHTLMKTTALVVLATIIAGLLAVPTAGAQGGPDPRLLVVTPVLNVRSGPGASFPAVEVVRQGTEARITGHNSATGWWQIELANGNAGWVSGATGLVSTQGTTDGVPEVSGPAVPVTTAAGSAARPAAGNTVVFQTASGGPIYVINSNGTGRRQLTTGMDPALSPDGRSVAFTRWQSSTPGTPGSLWVIGVDGTGERAIATDLRQPKSPTWSPDGKRIVVNQQHGGSLDPQRQCSEGWPPPDASDITVETDDQGRPTGFCYIVPADPAWSLRVINAADGSFTDLPSETRSFSPTWNPSNDWQVIYHGRKGLQSMDVKRDANWQLTGDPGDRAPVFSPDGTKLALAYRQHDHWEIYVMNPDGSARTRLTETPYQWIAEQTLNGTAVTQWNNTAPVWSPDGKQIVFLTDRTGQWEFWIMNADGSGQRPFFPASATSGLGLKYDANDERMLSWK